jgi:pimeloyl-ACP methyl ester carboxylesterase
MTESTADVWFQSEDDLKLHALATGPRGGAGLPVICLPGISRTAEDFRVLLEAFASDAARSRRVIALDSRGRGLSDHDKKPENYSVPMEVKDLLAVLDAEKITRAVFVGTSRGGILTMVLAVIRPEVIAGAVLNDIGPVLNVEGLLRIKSYVGKLPQPRNWSEAVAILKGVIGKQFPAFSEQQWLSYVKRTWRENPHGFEPQSDLAISKALADIDPTKPPPPLWPQFDALAATAPVLILRGEHSDLLSRETVAEMKKRGKSVSSIEIPGQGHAPSLDGTQTIEAILEFTARCV